MSPSMTATRSRSVSSAQGLAQQCGLAGARCGHQVDRNDALALQVVAVRGCHAIVLAEHPLEELNALAAGLVLGVVARVMGMCALEARRRSPHGRAMTRRRAGESGPLVTPPPSREP